MGGEKADAFQTFVRYCQTAYNHLRKFHRILIILFLLMVPGGMPELSCPNDIMYMRDLLHLDISEVEVFFYFTFTLLSCLSVLSPASEINKTYAHMHTRTYNQSPTRGGEGGGIICPSKSVNKNLNLIFFLYLKKKKKKGISKVPRRDSGQSW